MSHDPCEIRHEKIAALAIGELDAHEAAELRGHLETCATCRSLYDEMVEEEAFVEAAFAKTAKAVRLPHVDLQRPGPAVPVAGAGRQLPERRRTWSPLRGVAVAAVVVLAVGGLFSRLMVSPSMGVTFAEVLQRMQKAISVQYTRTVEIEGRAPVVFQDMAMDAGRMRTLCSDGGYYVCNFVKGEQLFIDPARKVGQYTHAEHHSKDRLSSYLDWISTLHHTSGKLIRQEDRDGHRTNVFQVEQPFERYTIWADVRTNLPVRVERVQIPCKGMRVPAVTLSSSDFRSAGDGGGTPSAEPVRGRWCSIKPGGPGVRQERVTITLTGFVWDAALNESLFRLSPPEGFTASDVEKMDLGDASADQDALIATLRFWAELSGGQFPADVDAVPDVRSQIIRRFDKDGPAEQEFAEALKMANTVLKGLVFMQGLKVADNWSYAGKGVRLGDAGKPLCWWRPERESTYRVIYGDLSVRDVMPGELPRMPQR